MTFDEIKTKMESLGFKYQPQGRNGSDSVVGLFYRRVDALKRECLTNEGKLLFTVELSDHARYQNTPLANLPERYGFEADITGEFVSDLWTKLRVYGLRPHEFFEKHKFIEQALVRAWEAMA